MFTAAGLDFSDSESAAIIDNNLCLLNLNKRIYGGEDRLRNFRRR